MGPQAGSYMPQNADVIRPKSINFSARMQGLVFYNWRKYVGNIGGGNM